MFGILKQNGGQDKRKQKKGGDRNERGMRNRKENLRKGLGKENMVIRHANLDNNRIGSRNMEGKEGN